MGAWATDAFGNDDAMDWVVELQEAEGTEAIADAFEAVLEIEDDYLEVTEAAMGVAAAEVVAALLGRPAASLPEQVKAWIAGKPQPKSGLVKKAQRVVKRILKDSELKELWQESTDAATWEQGVRDLLQRLTPPA